MEEGHLTPSQFDDHVQLSSPSLSIQPRPLSGDLALSIPVGGSPSTALLEAHTEQVRVFACHLPACAPVPLSKMNPRPTHVIRNLGATASAGLHPLPEQLPSPVNWTGL